MSSFRVDLNDPPQLKREATPMFVTAAPPRTGRRKRVLAMVAGILGAVIAVGLIGGYLYWRSFYGTPQYSLALLIDAAKRDDKVAVDDLVDIDAVVDDFLPQITTKAVELYGRGIP